MYYQIVIVPESNGFGEWQCLPINGEAWEDVYDLIYEIRTDGDVYELGVDELPSGVQDIRGLIHNEPPRIFAIVDDEGRVDYVGITEIIT